MFVASDICCFWCFNFLSFGANAWAFQRLTFWHLAFWRFGVWCSDFLSLPMFVGVPWLRLFYWSLKLKPRFWWAPNPIFCRRLAPASSSGALFRLHTKKVGSSWLRLQNTACFLSYLNVLPLPYFSFFSLSCFYTFFLSIALTVEINNNFSTKRN